MHQMAPVVGVPAGKYVIRNKGLRSTALRMQHASGESYALVFDTEQDAESYIRAHEIQRKIPDLEVAPIREWLHPMNEKLCMVWSDTAPVEETLWLTCPKCGITDTTRTFESLPDEQVKCSRCGTTDDASRFRPRLVKNIPERFIAEPKPTEFRVRKGDDEYTLYMSEPTPANEMDEAWVLTTDSGWTFMSATDENGATWPMAFMSPFDTVMFKQALYGMPGMKDAKPMLTGLAGRLKDEYVQVIRQAYATCPACGELCHATDRDGRPICRDCGRQEKEDEPA